MIRTEYKQLTEVQKHYIETGKGLLNEFLLHLNSYSLPDVDNIDSKSKEEQEKFIELLVAQTQSKIKATEASFWFTQMSTT